MKSLYKIENVNLKEKIMRLEIEKDELILKNSSLSYDYNNLKYKYEKDIKIKNNIEKVVNEIESRIIKECSDIGCNVDTKLIDSYVKLLEVINNEKI